MSIDPQAFDPQAFGNIFANLFSKIDEMKTDRDERGERLSTEEIMRTALSAVKEIIPESVADETTVKNAVKKATSSISGLNDSGCFDIASDVTYPHFQALGAVELSPSKLRVFHYQAGAVHYEDMTIDEFEIQELDTHSMRNSRLGVLSKDRSFYVRTLNSSCPSDSEGYLKVADHVDAIVPCYGFGSLCLCDHIRKLVIIPQQLEDTAEMNWSLDWLPVYGQFVGRAGDKVHVWDGDSRHALLTIKGDEVVSVEESQCRHPRVRSLVNQLLTEVPASSTMRIEAVLDHAILAHDGQRQVLIVKDSFLSNELDHIQERNWLAIKRVFIDVANDAYGSVFTGILEPAGMYGPEWVYYINPPPEDQLQVID